MRIEVMAKFLKIFMVHMNILYINHSENSLPLQIIREGAPIILTTEPKIVNKYEAHSPISLKHMMPLWCPFLDPHQTTTHHSNKVPVLDDWKSN